VCEMGGTVVHGVVGISETRVCRGAVLMRVA
jgi:hypothetical protein